MKIVALALLAFSVNPSYGQDSSVSRHHFIWLENLNTKDESHFETYEKNAVFVKANGDILTGASQIIAHHQENLPAFDSIWVLASEQTHRPAYRYEICSMKSLNAQYTSLVITKGAMGKREFEFIAEAKTSGKKSIAIITRQREKWVEICNQHQAEMLVNELYHPNAIYFNHRPAISGTKAIAKEYRYMNNPDYQLDLKPLAFEQVNDQLAYEIGQCVGTYNGKYLLVWQKNQAGEWKILVDSDI